MAVRGRAAGRSGRIAAVRLGSPPPIRRYGPIAGAPCRGQTTVQTFVKTRTTGDPYRVVAHTISDVPFGGFSDALGRLLMSGAAGMLEVPVEQLTEALRDIDLGSG